MTSGEPAARRSGITPSPHVTGARLALLDENGLVIWLNPAWARLRGGAVIGVSGAAVGTNYVALCRRSGRVGALIADGIETVLRGEARSVELEYRPDPEHGGDIHVSVTRAPDGSAGALVLHTDVQGAKAEGVGSEIGGPQPSDDVGNDLTQRERDVLVLMAHGLDNHAVAGRLGIGYATVRAHARSLMAKLGARSRLEAVVTALRHGIVRLDDAAPGSRS